MARDAATGNAKWKANANSAGWLAGLQKSTKPIVAAAIAERGTMQTKFTAATAPGGTWERHLSAVTDAGIKQAAATKVGNYDTGIAQGADNQLKSLTKIVAYETANLPTIYAMPKGTRAASKARQNAWLDIMADGAGTLSAKD
jgi:hypothetical protein